MVWYYGTERPDELTSKIRLGQREHTINFCVEEIKEGGYLYRWKSVTLLPGVWTYSAIVNAIVTEKYPEDAMQAVINNYLADGSDAEAVADFNEMQQWRAMAKEVAKVALLSSGSEGAV